MLKCADLLTKINRMPGAALAAFTVTDLTDMHAVLDAGLNKNTPFIMLTGPSEIGNFGLPFVLGMARAAAESSSVPAYLMLDHCDDFDLTVRCVAGGYAIVMFDCSRLPLEENVRRTREIVRIAHANGVLVEGEIGWVPGGEGASASAGHAGYTDPAEAEYFFRQTGVDLLAISFGTVHGFYREKPLLDYRIIEETRRRTGAPIAMHGGSGLAPLEIRAALDAGVKKVNFSTDLRAAYTAAVKDCCAGDPTAVDHMKIFMKARQAVRKVAEEKLDQVNAPGIEALADSGG